MENRPVAKPSTVRTRRAYFDFKFGQLHVRTAFPTTGGFDEQVTLFCLHPEQQSSRMFAGLLSEIADVRSVYAPDLPGCGESDPAPQSSVSAAAEAVSDLANELRLRQIDLLGHQFGAGVALQLAAARPELVRRLILVDVPASDALPRVAQRALVMRSGREAAHMLPKASGAIPNGKFVDLPEYRDDLFAAPSRRLAGQIGEFLNLP
jgi:pimeloyl-ACP methyl ester carboxylesterase